MQKTLQEELHAELLLYDLRQTEASPDSEEEIDDVYAEAWEPGLSVKQKKLVWEMREITAAINWGERRGYRHLQRILTFALRTRLHEFIVIDDERIRRQQPV